ncbi:MAG: hypothetical protein MO852_04315 [Candidatus Devosia euplotis]|nr:hypothetical protein [Candidatus Devosia euplotis]
MGYAIIVLAVFFLSHTGGKASILVLAWSVERFAWTCIPLAVGGAARVQPGCRRLGRVRAAAQSGERAGG